MLKYVLFIAATIAGTQALCNIKNRLTCLDRLTYSKVLGGNKTIICSLAKRKESCLKLIGCQPKNSITFVNGVNTACATTYSNESACDFAKMVVCTYRFHLNFNKWRQTICKSKYKLKLCYTNNKCDAGFKGIERLIKKRCEPRTCNKENRKTCLVASKESKILYGNKTSICSLAKKNEICLKGFGCHPKRTITFFNGVNAACATTYSNESACDFNKMFWCTYVFYTNLHKLGKKICKEEQQLTLCYTNNKCDAPFERIERLLRRKCGSLCNWDKMIACRKKYVEKRSTCSADPELLCYSDNKCYHLLEGAKRRIKAQCGKQ